MHVGDTFQKELPLLTEGAIRTFAIAIGDNNPIHHSNEAAQASGLPGIVATGVQLTGFISAAIAEWIPGVMVRRLDVTFKKPVFADTQLTVSCNTISTNHLTLVEVQVRNGKNIHALGTCTLVLPKK